MREWNAADSHFVHRGLPKYIHCRHGKWTIYRRSTRSVVHLGIIQTQLGACGYVLHAIAADEAVERG